MSLAENLATRLLYGKAIDTWGEDAQLDQAMEELAELIVAINHYKRRRPLATKKILEGMADVHIVLGQLLEIFSEHRFEFDRNIDAKLGIMRERLTRHHEKLRKSLPQGDLFS